MHSTHSSALRWVGCENFCKKLYIHVFIQHRDLQFSYIILFLVALLLATTLDKFSLEENCVCASAFLKIIIFIEMMKIFNSFNIQRHGNEMYS